VIDLLKEKKGVYRKRKGGKKKDMLQKPSALRSGRKNWTSMNAPYAKRGKTVTRKKKKKIAEKKGSQQIG